jgi:hypothetical protein
VASRSRPAEPETIELLPTNPDPLASLDVYKVHVYLGGQRFTIPAIDAAGWLKILLDDPLNTEEIFPGLCGPADVVTVNQLIVNGVVTEDELAEAVRHVIEAASGRRWFITMRLCGSARANWDRVGGELACHGVTPFKVSLSYWLDALYATMIRLIMEGNPKKLTQFTADLTRLPPSEARIIDDVAEGNAFLAMMRQAR